MEPAVFVYIAFIIVFIILRVGKQKKKRKAWRPPAGAAGASSGNSSAERPAAERAGMPARGEDGIETLRRRLSSERAGAPPGKTDPVFEFLREISGGQVPASLDEEEEDEAVQTAWRAFRPEEGREAAQAPPQPEARGGPQPEAAKPAPAIPAGLGRGEAEAPKGKTAGQPAIPESAFSRISRLGPLQRAIVMAEVLGKPKALRGEDL
ncbi:MAG: hypothetical protein LBT33_04405 [Spirochaetia bacterium]|nr:hypothetical protein [Spirochaetia bacterium]